MLLLPWLLQLASLASATQISAGTSTLGGAGDTCTNIQEFSCVNDICDPRAGLYYGGRCRNGDNPSGTCQPSKPCNKPTAGHCLENVISAPGTHSMPTLGTPKHFYCVQVLNYDRPAVLYENADCSGRSCFIPWAGHWAAWSRGAQANCVEIDPIVPVSIPACLAPGQSGTYPPNGGFPSGVNEHVGGDFGLPASYDNSLTCNAPSSSAWPAPISRDSYDPPAGDANNQFFSGYPDDPNFDQSQLDPRSMTKTLKLVTRVEPIRPLVTTGGLRNAYAYRAAFLALATQVWWFIGQGGILQSQTLSLDDAGARARQFTVDHVVELNMIINFVSQTWDASFGISENAWILVQDFIRSEGRRAMAAPNGNTWCAIYDSFAREISGLGNLRGVAEKINYVKARALASVLPAAPVPDWAGVGSKAEFKAVAEYFSKTSMQAQTAATAIGAALDVVAGSTPTQAFAKAFSKWVVGQWANAYMQMHTASL